MFTLDKNTERYLEYGSLILGAGGGGPITMGRTMAESAAKIGKVRFISVDELKDDDMVVTISGVGSPASKTSYISDDDYADILDKLAEKLGKKPAALIPCEMGGASSFGPFVAAAKNDIPILDAGCNGRAHPLGTMGAMGLAEDEHYVSTQVAIGGNPALKKHLEIITSGGVSATATMVLKAAIEAGGLVAVARHPVDVAFVKKFGALGCYTQAIKVGEIYDKAGTAKEKIEAVAKFLNGEVIATGVVKDYVLNTTDGLDVGHYKLSGDKDISMDFWNEYMAASVDGKRKYTFPDFMMSFDADTAESLTTAYIKDGLHVALVCADKKNLILGGGMFKEEEYKHVEKATGLDMISYLKDIL